MAKMKEEAHAQKLAQKQQSFDQKISHQDTAASVQNASTLKKTETDVAAKDLTTAAEIHREAMQPELKPSE